MPANSPAPRHLSFIGMVISGGHTSLYHCHTPLDLEYLGGTIDDAAGEAFDKVAAMLRLGFPGGPAVSRWAALATPQLTVSLVR